MNTFLITLSNGIVNKINANTRAEACNIARDLAGNDLNKYLSYEDGYVYITKVICKWAD